LVALGAKRANSIPEAVNNAEVVITMLSSSAVVAAVAHGPEGLLLHMSPRSIHLCMSTIAIETSAILASAHAQAGQGYVAAPVFGGTEAAASRDLWIFAGGPESQVNRCLPVFVALGRGLTRVGAKAPLAHALKLGATMLTEAMEEALSRIGDSFQKSGLAPSDYSKFLNLPFFSAPLSEVFGEFASLAHAGTSLGGATNEQIANHPRPAQPSEAPPMEDLRHPKSKSSGIHGLKDFANFPMAPHTTMDGTSEETASQATEPLTPAQSELMDLSQLLIEQVAPGESIETIPLTESAKLVPPPVPSDEPLFKLSTNSIHVSDNIIPIERIPIGKSPTLKSDFHVVFHFYRPALFGAIQSGSGTGSVVKRNDHSWFTFNTDSYPIPSPEIETTRSAPSEPMDFPMHSPEGALPDNPIVRSAPPEPRPQPPTPFPGEGDKTPFPICPIQPGDLQVPGQGFSTSTFMAMDGELEVRLDLNQTSHFEVIHGRVWAWSAGKRYGTPWSSIIEVEQTFSHVLLLNIQRNILLRPEATLELRPAFGGGAKVLVEGNIELSVRRNSVPRLRELLGI
jgi:hypothetical protein